MASTTNITLLLSSLIAANHVLDFNGVADAFGHVSVRNPLTNTTFFLSKNQAPALVSKRSDIIEYFVENGTALDPNAAAGYAELFIHSEALKRFPEINSVVHAHSPIIVPYSLVSDVELQPAYGVAGFLGDVPNFDIERYYNDSHPHNMLVNNNYLGAALASTFTTPATNNTDSTLPDHTFALMRGHGFTTMNTDIEGAIYRAVYAQSNAQVQSSAVALAEQGGGGMFHHRGGGVHYLNARERRDSATFNQGSAGKPWPYWVRQTEANPLYKNELGSPIVDS